MPRGTEARGWNDSAGSKGKPRTDNYHHEPGRSKEGSIQRKHSPADTLILYLQPPELRENKFLLLLTTHFVLLCDRSPRKLIQQPAQQEKNCFICIGLRTRDCSRNQDTHHLWYGLTFLATLFSFPYLGLNRNYSLIALIFFPLKQKFVRLVLLRACTVCFWFLSIFNQVHRAYQRESINCYPTLLIVSERGYL